MLAHQVGAAVSYGAHREDAMITVRCMPKEATAAYVGLLGTNLWAVIPEISLRTA